MGRANARATHRAVAFAQHAHYSSADVSHMHTAGGRVSRAITRAERQRACGEPRGMCPACALRVFTGMLGVCVSMRVALFLASDTIYAN